MDGNGRVGVKPVLFTAWIIPWNEDELQYLFLMQVNFFLIVAGEFSRSEATTGDLHIGIPQDDYDEGRESM